MKKYLLALAAALSLYTPTFAGTSSQFSCSPLSGSSCGVVFDIVANDEIIELTFGNQRLQYCNGTWANYYDYDCYTTGTIRLSNGDLPIELLANEKVAINLKKRMLYCFVLFQPSVCDVPSYQ